MDLTKFFADSLFVPNSLKAPRLEHLDFMTISILKATFKRHGKIVREPRP